LSRNLFAFIVGLADMLWQLALLRRHRCYVCMF